MSELQLDNSEDIFSIDKNTLVFPINTQALKDEKTFNSNNQPSVVSEIKLQIKNLTNQYVAFRVKTTKKQNYAVNPTYTIISPNSTQTIEIAYYITYGEKIDEKGHKFKFEGFTINFSQKNLNPKDIFQEIVEKNESVHGSLKKLLVRFIEDNNYNCYLTQSQLKLKQDLQGNQNSEEDTNLGKSLYSVAQDRPQKSVLRAGGKKQPSEQTEKEMLDRLKDENQRLRDQMDNLNLNCSKLRSRIESEKKSPGQSQGTNSNKYMFKVPEMKEKKISNIVLISALVVAILFGFYLAK